MVLTQQISSGIAPQINLRPFSPLDFLTRSAEIYREKIAVIDGDVQRTYPQMLERVYRFAHVLHSYGVKNGERVAFIAKNESPLLEAHYSVPLAGGVLCAINIRLMPDEIAYIIGHCGASIVVYDAEFAPLLEKVPGDVARIAIGADGAVPQFETLLLQASSEPIENPVVDEDQTICINYTSGTTGMPKGVMYTHRGAAMGAIAEIYTSNIRPESVYLWTLPMFHCNGWCYTWGVTAAGATHVCLPKIDYAKIYELVDSAGVTHLCGAPTVLIGIANHTGAKVFERGLQVTTAGAPPSPTTIQQMEALNASVTHVYGLTETYGPFTVCSWKSQWNELPPGERAKLKSRQGFPMVMFPVEDLRVVDSEMNDVPKDGQTQGEVVMRGNGVMKGYYNDAAATAKAFAGGFFHSGDVGVWHPDGYIELTDRAKDIIISGGENISTIQVEKVVLQHPSVLECAVVAAPDPKWGEVPKAFVTLKLDAQLSEDELIAFCRERLPGFKTPKAIEFGELPKTSTGKIQKFVLREREWKGKDRRIN
jgi:fatty-acyl-CoA synthase